jgi:hypothetical protein
VRKPYAKDENQEKRSQEIPNYRLGKGALQKTESSAHTDEEKQQAETTITPIGNTKQCRGRPR